MLTLFLSLILAYPQTGVRFAAYSPAQERVVTGRIAGVGDEVVIVTQGRLFIGQVSLLIVQRNRVYVEAWGAQDGIEAFAAIEAEDGTPQGKVDRMQVAVLLRLPGGGLFPGRPLACYPIRLGVQAVEIID